MRKDSIDYSWAKPLWREIEQYIENLPETGVNSTEVFTFLKRVEQKIRCTKCRKHFKSFPKPNKFRTRNEVQCWFDELNIDIKKQNLKGVIKKTGIEVQKNKAGVKKQSRSISKRFRNVFNNVKK